MPSKPSKPPEIVENGSRLESGDRDGDPPGRARHPRGTGALYHVARQEFYAIECHDEHEKPEIAMKCHEIGSVLGCVLGAP